MPLALDHILAGVASTGVRVASMMIFPPFFGSQSIPSQIKVGLAVAITILLYPVTPHPAIVLDALGWTKLIAGEALVGLLFGLSLQSLFEAAQIAGQIMGVQTGFSLITLLDPQSQADTPVLSMLHILMTLLIFLQLNVHHWVLRGTAASFHYLPPGQVAATLAATSGLLHNAGGMWLAGLQIAAPVILATMLSDVALGFIAKASPQLPAMIVGLSIKNLMGLTVLTATLALWPRTLEQHFAAAISTGERLLHLAQ